MLKCAIFADFLDFETAAATLTQLHARKDKNTWVSCILAEEQTLLH